MKDHKKGLSFQFSGKLNMQLGINDFSANEVINKMNEEDLFKIFKYFGDEKMSKLISKNIIKERNTKQIQTQNLVKIIEKIKKKR